VDRIGQGVRDLVEIGAHRREDLVDFDSTRAPRRDREVMAHSPNTVAALGGFGQPAATWFV
jgi:hypothetical protein